MASHAYDAVVIGGGIIGCTLALRLRGRGSRVLVLEAEPSLIGRASYANQARVHQGYHYPRSILTGLRSRVNFKPFVEEFAECIDDTFEQYYAIGRHFSKTTAGQFRVFCSRIQAFLEPAPPAVRRLFNPQWVDEVFRTREYAFDAARLRARLAADLEDAKVDVWLACEARRVRAADSGLIVSCVLGEDERDLSAAEVFNCTYSGLNRLLDASGLPVVPLRHELTELALVEPPPALHRAGITLMDGPFFSFMPFPARGLHSLSHVRYTPHHSWNDGPGVAYRSGEPYRERRPASRYPHMVKDAARYVPLLADCRYVESLWEIKTVLPRSDVDDSRPILVRRNHGLPDLTCILGAKVDNIYDVFDDLGLGAGARAN